MGRWCCEEALIRTRARAGPTLSWTIVCPPEEGVKAEKEDKEGKPFVTDSHSPQNDEQDYWASGAERAHALGNRGPLRFDGAGQLDESIREAYEKAGFYVFTSLLDETELSEFDQDLDGLLNRAPADEGSPVDRAGKPAAGVESSPVFLWAQALSDPWGGTELLNGRHPVAMDSPSNGSAAPVSRKSIFLILNLFEEMPAAVRLYAHPQLLQVAGSLNGPDFVPYNDSLFRKEPGLGAAVAWHQDGTTHWDRPDWHPDIHGFNFMAQLHPTTPANALWIVPGSHREGRIDIPARVAANQGSTRLPDAVPMLCDRGDVVVCNRQCLHGSFANASADPRATFVWGFFRRDSVLGAETPVPATRPGQAPDTRRYSEADVDSRDRVVQLAIAARRAHRPEETPYRYKSGTDEALETQAESEIQSALQGYSEGTIFI